MGLVRYAGRFGAMWLTIVGTIAALLVVLVVVVVTVSIRALRKFVRSVWPHS